MEIKELRKELDVVDKELAKLFEKRMKIIEKVRICKLENNLPVLDQNRENNMLDKNIGYIEDKELVEYYKNFLKACMQISKEYMSKKNNELR